MTDSEYIRISDHMKKVYGIDLTGKKAIMEGRMNNMIAREGYDTYTEYINAVMNDASGEMEKELVNVLTTNHTYFNREFEHFEFLRDTILPYFKNKESSSKDLRIWCGASSTGEEPYMLAMTLISFFGLEHKDWDTKILATDIATEALQTAIRGQYSKEAVTGLSEQWKRRFFKPVVTNPEMVEVTKEVKDEVIFRQFNLMHEFPFKRKMHVVFLRNVMIYFDQNTKNDLVQRIFDLLEPGGYLITGKTEAVDTEVIPFEMVCPSIFRKPL